MPDKYAGSGWLEESLKIELSPLGKEVGDLLGDLFFGIYHLDHKELARTDWKNDHHIIFLLGHTTLSTFDYDELTRLVILCHERTIRCSIRAKSLNYLELMFHKRQREGSISQRHPTIDKAVEDCRSIYVSVNQPE